MLGRHTWNMFLALKEMRRAKARFALLMGSIGLLVFLVLFQQSLQTGLISGFVGGVRNQSAPVIVYSVDGRRNLQGGVLVPDLEAQVRGVEGIGMVGRLSLATFTAQAGGHETDASVIGYDDVALGAPRELAQGRYPDKPGEAVADESGASNGFAIGDVVTLDPAGFAITVVGLARDVQINVQPTLFVPYATYEAAVRSRFPDATTVVPNALAVSPASGVSDATLVARINALSDDLDALTRADAAAKTPGVATVKQSFSVIFLLYGLVVPFLTGLFFLILTFQKSNSLTLLRAIGAPSSRLVTSLLIQVLIVIAGGLVIGVALYAPLSQQQLGSISLRFETGAVIFWSILLLVFGLLSSLVSARRVLAIDPVAATTGAG
jgi:putative ABC transport system permease protein